MTAVGPFDRCRLLVLRAIAAASGIDRDAPRFVPLFWGLRLVPNRLNKWWPRRRWDPPRPFHSQGGSRDCELGRCLGYLCG
jgi:hypothetical protein